MEKKQSMLAQVKKRTQETTVLETQNDAQNHYEMLKKTIILRTETEIKSQMEIAKALYEIKTNQLYLYDGYKSFSQFLKDYNKGRTQAYRYIAIVDGIHRGLIKESDVVDKGFKAIQQNFLVHSIKKPNNQFLLSFSLNHIDQPKKRQWFTDHKDQIEAYILKQINLHFSDFEKEILKK